MKFGSASLVVFLFLLAACSPGAPSIESGSPATPPEEPVATDSAAAPPATEATAVAGVIFGRNDDGTFFHGAADATVTFIDYSDFL